MGSAFWFELPMPLIDEEQVGEEYWVQPEIDFKGLRVGGGRRSDQLGSSYSPPNTDGVSNRRSSQRATGSGYVPAG